MCYYLLYSGFAFDCDTESFAAVRVSNLSFIMSNNLRWQAWDGLKNWLYCLLSFMKIVFYTLVPWTLIQVLIMNLKAAGTKYHAWWLAGLKIVLCSLRLQYLIHKHDRERPHGIISLKVLNFSLFLRLRQAHEAPKLWRRWVLNFLSNDFNNSEFENRISEEGGSFYALGLPIFSVRRLSCTHV